ncbi:MAG TPA: hypothetical protein VN132_07920, partial [Bdellovibrio sp.]|nr:hypothetical protein [Bdellovibrio sp.]
MATAAGLLLDEPIDKSHLEAQLVDLLNSYARLYRLYDLIMIVSPRGQVLAMNSEDIMGRIHTSSMFSSMDIEHADWFAKPMAHI